MAKFSPGVQKLVNNAKRVAPPPRRPGRKLFDRCTTVHDGQRITFDLTTAKTCPPGFFGLKNGGGMRVAKIEKVASSSATKAGPRKPRVAKKAPAKRKAAAKKAPAKKKNGNGNGSKWTVAKVKAKAQKLYKDRKLGEASKLLAQARRKGLAV